MQKIVGQKRLIPKLQDLWENYEFPQSVLLTGPAGSGKETVALHLAQIWDADYLHYPVPKVDDVREIIEASKTLPEKTIFVIADAHKMNMPSQNALLKTLEEPPLNAVFILTAEHADLVLPTIKSRCAIFEMDYYTPDDLAEITDDEELQKMFTTPGQIMRAQAINIDSILETTGNVVDYIGRVSAWNTFNILHHIEKEDQYDLFLDCLLFHYRKRAQEHDVTKELNIVAIHKQLMKVASVNKTALLEMMLMDLRRARLWNSKNSEKN